MTDGPLPTLEQLEAALYVEAIRRAGSLQAAVPLLGVSQTTAYRRFRRFRAKGLLEMTVNYQIRHIFEQASKS